MATPLPRSFYEQDAVQVAEGLLGARLVRREADGSLSTVMIVETEAYSQDDPASHSFNGRTPRTEVMFDRPGLAYVYFIYGMYYCFNVVCEPAGTGAAVLIRAAEPVAGCTRMFARRKPGAPMPDEPLSQKQRGLLASGPGKLCQALAITRDEHNGLDLCSGASTLWIEAPSRTPASGEVLTGRRIGIREAQETPWRFGLADSYALSPYRFEGR